MFKEGTGGVSVFIRILGYDLASECIEGIGEKTKHALRMIDPLDCENLLCQETMSRHQRMQDQVSRAWMAFRQRIQRAER